MAYPAFPEIKAPNYPLKETPEDPGIKTKMEDGLVKSRARFTRARRSFSLSWEALSTADKERLMNFYQETVKGSSALFTWIHPQSGITYNVRFSEPIETSLVLPGFWSVTATVEEV